MPTNNHPKFLKFRIYIFICISEKDNSEDSESTVDSDEDTGQQGSHNSKNSAKITTTSDSSVQQQVVPKRTTPKEKGNDSGK